jgi:hypothetical protein
VDPDELDEVRLDHVPLETVFGKQIRMQIEPRIGIDQISSSPSERFGMPSWSYIELMPVD